jgi:protein tyrosine phosphatase (PTP) superfamily phosphohydrolase (DUF442 family)
MSVTPLFEIPDFLPLSPVLATSGQPSAEQFGAIAAAGYERVINLAMPSSTNWLAVEPEVVAGQGMTYVHIPVEWENPTLADWDRMVAELEAEADRKIWVHCAKNMRVSAFIYLYHRITKGYGDEVSRRYLEQIWVPNAVWQGFIEAALDLYMD